MVQTDFLAARSMNFGKENTEKGEKKKSPTTFREKQPLLQNKQSPVMPAEDKRSEV